MCNNLTLGVGAVHYSNTVTQQESALLDSNAASPALEADDDSEVYLSSTSRTASIGFENTWRKSEVVGVKSFKAEGLGSKLLSRYVSGSCMS